MAIHRLPLNLLHKCFSGLALLSVLLTLQKARAREFIVGGSNGWRVPAGNKSEDYGQWAERSRFQIGDSVVFVYPPNQDSVLQVNKDAYTNCNTDAPIRKFTDGHTSVKFDKSGPHYFISGNKDNCHKSEKVVIIVMADRSSHSPAPTNEATPPSPPPMPQNSPVEAPASDTAPSPPPMRSTDSIPAPAPGPNPSEKPHRPSSAPALVISLIGSAGAMVSSALLML